MNKNAKVQQTRSMSKIPMSVGCAPQPDCAARENDVPAAMGELACTVGYLESRQSELQERLMPVSRPGNDIVESPTMDSHCSVSEQMRTLAYRIDRVARLLNCNIGALEI